MFFDHDTNMGYGPGSAWVPEVKTLLIPKHRISIDNLFSSNQYHLFVKCGYARAFVERDETLPFWGYLYDKMQVARIGESRRKRFDAMLLSCGRIDFLFRNPIPVDDNYEILDGSHRVALAYAYNYAPYVVVYDNHSHSYDRNWFEKNGFIKDELFIVDKIRDDICSRVFVDDDSCLCVVWGCAFDFWEEIFSKIGVGHGMITAFWVEFKDQYKMRSFVEESYLGDGMPVTRIRDKSARLAVMSTKAGIFALGKTPLEEVHSFKLSVRQEISPRMANYFFDSIIHIIDCKKTAATIFKKYRYGKRAVAVSRF